MMNTNDNHKDFQADELEKWLESFFLDPFTSYLDQTQFRIDLYETNTELIIEALLVNYKSSEVTVHLNGSNVLIKACSSKVPPKERTITFPFIIISQKVTASYSNDILEIIISKVHQDQHKNRYITLSK